MKYKKNQNLDVTMSSDIQLKQFTGCYLYKILNIEPSQRPASCEFFGEMVFRFAGLSLEILRLVLKSQ